MFLADTGCFQQGSQISSPSGSLLWALLEGMSRLLRAETQAVEGINSMIRIMDKRSPNISLELLSSRLVIKKALDLHSQPGGKRSLKFSVVKPVAEAVLSEITQHKLSCLSVLADANRWAPIGEPPPAIAASSMVLQDDHLESSRDLDMMRIADLNRGGHSVGADICISGPSGPGGGASGPSGSGHATSSDASAAETEVNLWAKSYNKGYKWRTRGNKQGKAGKTTGPVVVKHRGQGIVGLGLVTFKLIQSQTQAASSSGDDLLPDFYIVVDRFAHSVSFSKLSIKELELEGTRKRCLVWDTSWTSRRCTQSIESIQMMSSFYVECVLKKSTVEVKSTLLDSSRTLQLLAPEEHGYLLVDDVLVATQHLFTMDSKPMTGVTIVRTPKSKSKPKVPASEEEPLAFDGDGGTADTDDDDQKLFLDDGEHGSDASSIDQEVAGDGSLGGAFCSDVNCWKLSEFRIHIYGR